MSTALIIERQSSPLTFGEHLKVTKPATKGLTAICQESLSDFTSVIKLNLLFSLGNLLTFHVLGQNKSAHY